MGKNLDEGIDLFVRDEQTGRLMFNATAMRALGIEPAQMRQCGYLLKDMPETAEMATPAHVTAQTRK